MTNETRTGTELEQLAECKGCSALLAPNIAVSTTTPGLQFSAIVFADVPCQCGRKARVLFKFGGTE
jgi:RNase P subunit RPR2